VYFNSVGERVEAGSVGMEVAGIGVGADPSVGGGPTVSATAVLTIAVISIGVDTPAPLSGMIGPQAVRNTARTIIKTVDFFISASLFPEDFHTRQNVPLFSHEQYRAGPLMRNKSHPTKRPCSQGLYPAHDLGLRG